VKTSRAGIVHGPCFIPRWPGKKKGGLDLLNVQPIRWKGQGFAGTGNRYQGRRTDEYPKSLRGKKRGVKEKGRKQRVGGANPPSEGGGGKRKKSPTPSYLHADVRTQMHKKKDPKGRGLRRKKKLLKKWAGHFLLTRKKNVQGRKEGNLRTK